MGRETVIKTAFAFVALLYTGQPALADVVISPSVKYTASPVRKIDGRRISNDIKIEVVQLVSAEGLSKDTILAVNTKLKRVAKEFKARADECHKGAQGHPWGYESKLAKIALSKRYISLVFRRFTVCAGSPDIEMDAIVFAKASGKYIPARKLFKEVLPGEKTRQRDLYFQDQIYLNENLVDKLIEDSSEFLGSYNEDCDYYVKNAPYRIWMEDERLVLFPEFWQPVSHCQKGYIIKVKQ